jgi:hypothetical protein
MLFNTGSKPKKHPRNMATAGGPAAIHVVEDLVVSGIVRDGVDLVRLRRQAHGIAGWITTKTTDITVELGVVAQPVPVS